MKHRVWIYLRPEDIVFLDVMGGLIGTQSRHEQMEFTVKLCRLIIPDPKIVPYIMSKARPNGIRDISMGPSIRAWVYLNQEDLEYLKHFAMALKIKSRSKTMRYIIKMVKLFLRNTELISKSVEEALSEHTLQST